MPGEEINNLEYIMNASYDSLMMDIGKTLDEFIVFQKNDEVVEINECSERVIFIDGMISFFESIEQFEKCAELVTLKEMVTYKGDQN